MKEKLFFFSIKHPLSYILLLAIVVRILAAVLTSGWIAGWDYNFNNYRIPGPWFDNPWIVYISRLILGAFSLLVITLAYRITKIIADKTTALEIATFCALLWGMPFVSVHPFPAAVALPFLLYGTLLIMKQHNLLENNEIEKFHRTTFIVAGFFLGMGFAAYYQSLIYYIGILLTLFILKNWKGALMSLIGYVLAVGITQTIVDLVVYHRPLVAMSAFLHDLAIIDINYELTAMFICAMMIPPMSLMLIFGFFRVLRKYIILVLPALLTMIYSIFTNNNLDLLIMIAPTYLIAGYVGWKEFYKNSAFWTNNKWLLWTCYSVFALMNIAMIIYTFVKL